MNVLLMTTQHTPQAIADLEAELATIHRREGEIAEELTRLRAILAIAQAASPCASPPAGANVPACPPPPPSPSA